MSKQVIPAQGGSQRIGNVQRLGRALMRGISKEVAQNNSSGFI